MISVNKRKFCVAAAVAMIFGGALSLSAGIAHAAPKYTAKLSVDVQTGNPKEVAAQNFAKRVADATGGEVEIKVFANSLLGGERDVSEGMRLGSVQMGIVTSSVLGGWVPELQVMDLPFLIRDDRHVVAISKALTPMLAPTFESQGFHLLGFSANGARELMSRFPILKPEDVKGKKMRVIQSPIHVALWKTVGANPVPIPAPEIYNSLQTGVVDFFDNTATNYLTFKFFEVAPHYTQLDHIFSMGTWVVSEAWWKKLPEQHRAAITKAAVETQAEIPAMLEKTDTAALAETAKKGATIHKLSAAEKAEWRLLMAPVYEEFSTKIPRSKELISAIELAK